MVVLVVPILVNFAGIVVISAVIAIIHDFFVDDFSLSNFNALGIPATAPAAGTKIVQSVSVSFDFRYRKLFFGTMFGLIQPVAYLIALRLDTNRVRCDQTLPQACPQVSGGIGTSTGHVEAKFLVQWDPGRGTFDLPIDVSLDGKQVTNVSGGPDLKVQLTVT